MASLEHSSGLFEWNHWRSMTSGERTENWLTFERTFWLAS